MPRIGGKVSRLSAKFPPSYPAETMSKTQIFGQRHEGGYFAFFGHFEGVLIYAALATAMVLSFQLTGEFVESASLLAPLAVGLSVLAGLRFRLAGAIASGLIAVSIFWIAYAFDWGALPERGIFFGAGLALLIALFSFCASLVVGFHMHTAEISGLPGELVQFCRREEKYATEVVHRGVSSPVLVGRLRADAKSPGGPGRHEFDLEPRRTQAEALQVLRLFVGDKAVGLQVVQLSQEVADPGRIDPHVGAARPVPLLALTDELRRFLFRPPDADVGEAPVAFIKLAPGAEADRDELMDHLNSQVAAYKKIRDVIFLDEIPVSGAGKVLKRELRKTFEMM